MVIKFKKPPINEVVIGTYFNPPLVDLKAEHVGLFWSDIRGEYPVLSQQPPIGVIIETPLEIFPMPRYWLASKDDATLIQIQKNAFLFNWRKREETYPHYDSVKARFDKNFQLFSDFVGVEIGIQNLSIEVCELSYVNIIKPCEFWNSLDDTSNVIPSFKFSDSGVSEALRKDFNHVTIYKIDDKLSLTVTIKSGRTATNLDQSCLIFEIKATGRLGTASKSQADKWFSQAHKTIISCFTRMTNSDIQKKFWIPQEIG